jgi:hypothetical protein
VKTPFYYVPPFLDELRRSLQERLASTGGRPTVREWQVVRKTRFSKETWQYLARLADQWSNGGIRKPAPGRGAHRRGDLPGRDEVDDAIAGRESLG